MASRNRRSRLRRLFSKRLQARKASVKRRRLELESLEPRVLLTTLVGGDIFEYIDASGTTIRIATTGDLIAEIIAADIDDQNQIILGDMPGIFLASDIGRTGTEVLGGRGGGDGVEPVTLSGSALTPVTDPDFGPLSIGVPLAGTDNISFAALASRSPQDGGGTYGFNFGTAPNILGDDRDIIQLVRFDTPDLNGDGFNTGNATVQAMLHQATLREDNFALSTDLGTVHAFAADPTQPGFAYALNTEGALFRVSTVDGTVTAIGDVTNGGITLTDVRAMDFDAAGVMHLLVQESDNDPAADASGLPVFLGSNPNRDVALLRVDKSTGVVTSVQPVLDPFFGGVERTDLYTAMTFAEDGTIYAVARRFTDQGQPLPDQIQIITPNPGAPTVDGDQLSGFVAIGAGSLEGLTFAQNLAGETILAGMVITTANNQTLGQMWEIDPETGFFADPISEVGMVATVFDLTAIAEGAGERPLLYATDGFDVIRGSAVTLPTDLLTGGRAPADVDAAAFRPVSGAPEDGLLYFVSDGAFANPSDRLYTIDVDEANRTRIQNSMRQVADFGDGVFSVEGLAWDQTLSGPELWAFTSDVVGGAGFGALVQIDPSSGGFLNVIDVTIGGEQVLDLTALEFVNDDPNVAEAFFYATRADDTLLRIRRSTGTAFSLGGLSDPDDTVAPIRGEDLQGLTWNPELTNPFTGELGVLLATDATADELVFVDHRARFVEADAFTIFISQAGVNASIAIATVPDFNPQNPGAPRPMEPFTGDVGQIRVFPAQGGDLITVTAGGTGGVLIGTRTEDRFDGTTDEELLPLIAADMAAFFDEFGLGTRPSGLDNLLDDPFNNLSAGINGTTSVLEFLSTNPVLAQRLLGFNFDNVQGLAVSRDGRIVVIDNDNIDENGNPTGGQVGTVDPTTGQVGAPIVIRDAATGAILSNVQGLDFGDLDFDGVEDLYAILDTFNLQPSRSVGDLIDILNGSTDNDFVALAASDDGLTLYAIARIDGADADLDSGDPDDNYQLFQITRDVVTGQVTALTNMGVITDSFGNHIIDIDDISLNSTGLIYVAGWNQDAPVPNGNVGGALLTTTTLASLGVTVNAAGMADMVITTSLGTQFTVDFDSATVLTIQDVIDAINAAATTAGVTVTASIAPSGRALMLQDETGGTSRLTSADAVGAITATQLGLVAADVDGDTFLYGTPIATDGLGELNIQALAINQLTNNQMIALNSTGAVFELYDIQLNDDGVAGFQLIGEVNTAGGSAILDVRGFDGDSTGTFYAIGLPADQLVPTEEVGQNPGDGNLMANYEVLGLTVTADGTGYFLYDNDAGPGRDIRMAQILRDPNTGAITQVNQLGAIQDAYGNRIDDISGLSADELGNLFLIGFNESTPTPNVTVGTSIDATTLVADLFGGLGITFTSAGQADFTVTNRAGLTVSIDLDPATDLTIQDVIDAINTQGAANSISAALNVSKTGINIIDGSTGSGTLTVLDVAGSTIATQLGIAGTDTDLDGDVQGTNIATLGLGGAFDVVALTMSSDGLVGYAVVADDGNTVTTTDDSLQLWRVNRDATTGGVSGFTLVGTLVDSNGNRILDVNDIDMDSAGNLFVVGFNGGAPVPAGNVGGDLGGDFEDPDGVYPVTSDIVGLAITTDDNYFALHFNGASYNLRQIVRDPSTGATTAFNLIGQIQDGGRAILGLAALESAANGTDLFGVGTAPEAYLPTTDVGGTLDGTFDVEGLVADPDDPNQLWAIVNNGASLDLYSLTRSATTGQVTNFTLVGQISTNLGGTAHPETAILGIQDVDIDPLTGGIFVIGTAADQLVPIVDSGDPLIPTNLGNIGNNLTIRAISADPADRDIWYIDRDATPTIRGEHQFTQFNNVATRSPIGGPIFSAGGAAALGDEWGSDLALIPAIEEIGGTLFSATRNARSPRPSVNIGGNLGEEFDVRGLTLASDDDRTPYFVHFNGTTYDLFRMERDASGSVVDTTGDGKPVHRIGTVPLNFGTDPINFIHSIEADVENPNRFYIFGSTDEGSGAQLQTRLYQIDLTAGADATLGTTDDGFGVTQRALIAPSLGAWVTNPNHGVNAVAHDPLNPNHLYFSVWELNIPRNPQNPPTESILYRYDLSTDTLAAAAGAGTSWIRGRVDGNQGVITDIIGMDFNEFGDILAYSAGNEEGAGGSFMVRINRFATADFTAGISNSTGAAPPLDAGWRVSEQGGGPGGIQEGFRGFTTDARRVAGTIEGGTLSFTINANTATDELWVNSRSLWSWARTTVENTEINGANPLDIVGTTLLGELVKVDLSNPLAPKYTAVRDDITALAHDPSTDTLYAALNVDTDFDGTGDTQSLVTISRTRQDLNGDGVAEELLVTFVDGDNGDNAVDAAILFNFDATGDGFNDGVGGDARVNAKLFDFDFTLDGQLVGIHNAVLGVEGDEVLVAVNRIDPAASVQLTDPLQTNLDDDMRGFTIDFLGRAYSVHNLTAGTSDIYVSESNQDLFTVATSNVSAGTDPRVLATSIGLMQDNFELVQRPVTDMFTGLAFLPLRDASGAITGRTLYGIQRDISPPADLTVAPDTTDRLVTIEFSGVNAGRFTRVDANDTAGAIRLGGTDMRVEDIDFTLDGRLIGIAFPEGLTYDSAFQLAISLEDPTQSSRLTENGTAADLQGLTSDGDGRFYSTEGTGTFDRLFISSNALALYNIASGTGAATIIGNLTNNGSPVTDKNQVRGLALAPNGLDLYAVLRVDSNNDGLLDRDQLIVINSTSGAASDLGVIRVANADTEITAIEFNALGQLIGIDKADTTAAGDRMVLLNINLAIPGLSAPGLSTELTPDGSVDADLRGLAADALGRFYSINVGEDFDELWTTATQLYGIDETTAVSTAVGEIWDGPAVTGGMVTDSFVSIAFDQSDTLYAVRDTVAGQTLVTIARPTPDPTVPTTNDLDGFAGGDTLGELQLTTIDRILFNGNGSNVTAMDFNRDNELVAINDNGTGPRMAIISTVSPAGFSELRSDPGVVDPNLRGLASDGEGRFYAIHLTAAGGNGELWKSSDQIFAITPRDTDGDTVDDTVEANAILNVTRDFNGINVAAHEAWGPLAIDANGVFYVIIDEDPTTGGSELAQLVNGVVTNLGPIQVGGVDRNIIAMAFTPGGGLIGIGDPDTTIDAGDRNLTAISIIDPSDSRDLTPAGTVGDDLEGLAIDAFSNFYSIGNDPLGVSPNDFLLVSANAQQLFTVDVTVGSPTAGQVMNPITITETDGVTPVSSSFTAVAFAPDNAPAGIALDTMFAVLREPTGDVLVTINRTTGVMTRLGAVVDNTGAPLVIQALEFTMDGELVAYDDSQGGRRMVGFTFDAVTTMNYTGLAMPRTNAGEVSVFGDMRGLTTDDTGRFYSINNTPVLDELWVSGQSLFTIDPQALTPGGTTLANFVAPITMDGAVITEVIQALAINPDDTTFQAVILEDNRSILLSGSIGSGAGNRVGIILVDGVDVDIDSMDYSAAGVLVAVDGKVGESDRRLIIIDTDGPADSTQLTPAGSIDEDLIGFTLDDTGVSYSINGGVSPDVLVASVGATSTLAIIDETTGTATGVGFLGSGQIVNVSAMAFSPDMRLFVIGDELLTGETKLFELDPNSGDVIREVGELTGAWGSMDFAADGTLYAHDVFNGRLVDLNYNFADPDGFVQVGLNTATPDGSLRPTVGAISFDPNFDSDADGVLDGRFLAVDNATGLLLLQNEGGNVESSVMMTVRGLTSTSAIGQNMDNVLIGGTVLGRVDWAGSIDTLHIGWILTGDASGMSEGSSPVNSDNFIFGGDLRALVTGATTGGELGGTLDEPVYQTGFDMNIRGRLGTVLSLDSITGQVHVLNQDPADGMSFQDLIPTEYEGRLRFGNDNAGLAYERFELVNAGFNNDTFDTAHRLGSVENAFAADPIVAIEGTLDSFNTAEDNVDYFAVSLLAGQTVTVQLQANSLMAVGVFDPDGRLVYSDYNNVDSTATLNQAFTFTADRAGEYRLAVGFIADVNFNGALDAGEAITFFNGQTPYILTLTGGGDIALGGVVALNHIYDNQVLSGDASYRVVNGDLGALVAGGTLLFEGTDVFGGMFNILVNAGNLRSIQGGQISLGDVGAADGPTFPTLSASGNLGQIRTTTGVARLANAVIGGDLQNVQVATDFYINLTADGGVGVIRAASMSSPLIFILDPEGQIVGNSTFQLNVDGIGFDGNVDYIGVSGDLGTIGNGGPYIHTGGGGNVRFIEVGGTVFQNSQYGGSAPDIFTTLPGSLEEIGVEGSGFFRAEEAATIRFIDDSGASITLAPTLIGIDTEENVDIGDPLNPHFLTIRTFGIASGGVVVVDVTSTGGVEVTGNGGIAGVGGEIGLIASTALGREFILDPLTGLYELEDEPDPLVDTLGLISVIVNGSAPIDIRQVGVPVPAQNAQDVTNYFEIRNNTPGGDILNVVANTIGTLFAGGSIGTTSNSTGAIVNPFTQIANVYPFLDQRFGVQTISHILSMSANEAIGNVIAGGDILSVIANADGVNKPDVFEGIVGPVQAVGDPALPAEGDILFVQIGEGVASSGSGNVSFAGIYAGGDIGQIVNQGRGSDIRGEIAAMRTIGSITLNNGSIINADIAASLVNYDALRELPTGGALTDIPFVPPLNDPDAPLQEVIELGNVTLTGIGGIIGSQFAGADMGNFNVAGFGILNSEFSTLGDGTIGNVSAGGFGMRGVLLTGGASMGDLTATGNGSHLDVLNYGESVRLSENNGVDPMFGLAPSRLTDLHAFLGTSVLNSTDIAGVTNSGIMEDVIAAGKQNLGDVSAWIIRGSTPLVPTEFNFANTIRSITTRGLAVTEELAGTTNSIENVTIVTGALGAFKPHGDVSGLDLTVRGELRSVAIKGNLMGDSIVRALGPNGHIKNFSVTGDMDGDIFVAGCLGTVKIGGNLSGDVTVMGEGLVRGDALRSLTLGGELTDGSFEVHGSVGSITTRGSFGISADAEDQLIIFGDLGKLTVGRRGFEDTTAMGLDLIVLGSLKNFCVYGDVLGDVSVTGDLGNVKIMGVAGLMEPFTGDLHVGGSLRGLTVTGMDVMGDIYVVGDIGNIRIDDGDLLAGAEIASTLGSIRGIQIRNGDLNGSLRADNGSIGTVRIGGSDLGANASITALELGTFQIDGSMLDNGIDSGATINVVNGVRMIDVAGDVEALAQINIGSTKMVRIDGDMAGTLTTTDRTTGISVDIGGDFTGRTTLAGEAKLSIDGAVINALIEAGRDLSLRVDGVGGLSGDVLVNGNLTDLMVSSLQDAVITAGYDMGRISVTNAIQRTLIQAGINRGAGDFGSGDAGEAGRMGAIGSLDAALLVDTIVAAGGHIGSLNFTTGMTRSTVSSGLVLGGSVVADVLDGDLDLSLTADRNAARSAADRQLFRGDIGNASVGVADDSAVTAGVDAGDNGIFEGDTLLSDDNMNVAVIMTGGVSHITRASAGMTSDALFIADGTVNLTGGGTTFSEVLSDAEFIALLTALNPLEDISPTIIGEGGSGNSFSLNGMTITITGPGSIEIHDDVTTTDRLDTLVLLGTTSSTKIEVTTAAGMFDLGRVITGANDAVGTFTTNGDILGDGIAGSADLWLDGGASTVAMRSMGDPNDENSAASWQGRIGSDVSSLSIINQGPGSLRIGGQVRSVTLGGSFGTPLAGAGADGLGDDVTQIAIDSSGVAWAFNREDNTVQRLDADTLAPIGVPIDITQAFGGAAVTLNGLDFDGGDVLNAVANAVDLAPNVLVGSMSNNPVSLTGLAVDRNGRIVAVENNGYLPSQDLGGDFNFVAVTTTADGTLFAVNDNLDGSFSLYQIDRDANGNVTAVTSVGAGVDGIDGNADDGLIMDAMLENVQGIAALEVNDVTGELYVAGTTTSGGANQRIFSVSTTTAQATVVGELVVVPPGTRELEVTPTTSSGALLNALLAGRTQAELGLSNLTLTVSTNTGSGGASGAGTFNNTARIYGIRDGIIISSGDVGDYEDGSNTSPSTTTAYGLFGFGAPATTQQEVLLDTITGGGFDHNDVTQITINFDLLPGFDRIFFDVVWGSEEFSEFVGSPFIDAFGMFVNGTNVAVANGSPINVDHPEMAVLPGTELDGVLAPNGNPVMRFERVLTDGQTGNTLILIIADSTDADLDSTAYISGLGAVTPATIGVTEQVTGLSFTTDPSDPSSKSLFATIHDGTSSRLLKVALTPTDEDFNPGEPVEELAVLDQGQILIDGAATNLQGIDFDASGNLIGINDNGTDDHRVLINTGLPTLSTFYSRPGADPDNLDGLTSNDDGRFFSIQNNSGSNDLLMSFNGTTDRLVEINPTTGAITPIGEIRTVFNQPFNGSVQQLAFDSLGRLLVLVGDQDGTGTNADFNDGVALGYLEATDSNSDGIVRISATNNPLSPARFLDINGGLAGVQPAEFDFTGLAVHPTTGTIFASYDNGVDGNERLVSLTPAGTSVTAADLGDLGAVDFVGIGFSEAGQLYGLSVASGNCEVFAVNTATAVITLVGTADSVNANLDAFAINFNDVVTGDIRTFGYDFDSVRGGQFFTNTGMSATLGTVDGSGAFRYSRGLVETDGNGAFRALSAGVTAVALDSAGLAFVATDDGRLICYDPTSNPSNFADYLHTEFGTVVDRTTGEALQLSGLEFDGSGNLIGIDSRFGRMVIIDLDGDVAGDGVIFCEPVNDSGLTAAGELATLAFDPLGGRFLSFNAGSSQVVQLQGASHLNVGGIVANSVDNLDITGPYGGRVATIGNSFGNVRITGDYSGVIATVGEIKSVQQVGAFTGTIAAGESIGRVQLDGGAFDGSIVTGGDLGSFSQRGGAFSGALTAASAGTVRIDDNVFDGAVISVAGNLSMLDVAGTFDGRLAAGSADRVGITGDLSATGQIVVARNLGSLSIGGDTDAGSTIETGRNLDRLDVRGTHNGSVIVGGSLGSANFGAITDATVTVALDAGSVNVSGKMTRSLLAVGVDVGDDGVFNTDDDQIIGGVLGSLRVGDEIRDSAIAAGVLPHESYGPGRPTDHRGFTGNSLLYGSFGADLTRVDAAEAGGIRPSGVGRVDVRGNVSNATTVNVIAAAGSIGPINANGAGNFLTRSYNDPVLAPRVDGLSVVNDSEFAIFFSEPINSGSIVLSQDTNNDGDLTDLGDIVGTLTLRDQATGAILDSGDGISLAYQQQVAADGTTQGVLRVRKAGGLEDRNLLITLEGDIDGEAVIDRSGLRSALRDFNRNGVEETAEDPYGTILDGDNDFTEGGDAVLFLSSADAPSDFISALDQVDVPLAVDGGTLTVRDSIEDAGDIDIYRFQASAFQFLAIDYTSEGDAEMGIFFHDDQGTASTLDDTFELVSRHELQSDARDLFGDGGELFQAMELSDTGTYFVVISSSNGGTGDYELDITLSSTDAALIEQLGGVLPTDEVIGYVSNEIGDNNNLLGANDPRQIVFLDFDGGLVTQGLFAGITMGAFNAGELDPTLAGQEDLLLNGNLSGIDGIVDNILSIYGDIPRDGMGNPLHPAGDLTVTLIDDISEFALYNAANATGIFFTTIDPTLAIASGDLSAATPYTTVLTGSFNVGPGLLGIASTVDFMNMSKADSALTFSNNFAGFSNAANLTDRVNEYARALANTIAHELGHTLGFNHSGSLTEFNSTYPFLNGHTDPDDLDNDPSTPDTSNVGTNVMGSGPTSDAAERVAALRRFGTAPITPLEFPVGDVDHLDQLLKWLA